MIPRLGRERRSALTRAAWVIASLGLLAGCAEEERAGLPEGAWAYGEVAAVRPWLEGLTALEASPAAELASEALGILEGCDHFTFHATRTRARVEELVASLRCANGASAEVAEPADVAELRGDARWIGSWPLEDAGRAVLRGPRAGEEAGRLSLELPASLGDGALGLLLPAAAGGPALLPPAGLEAAGTLVHLRVRADRGLDPAELVPAGSPADRLFGLRGRLFSKAVLGDTWEVAVLPPEPGDDAAHLPLVAALGLRSRTAAEAAITAFEAELGRVWGLVARPLPLESGGRATCFDELRVLPGLHPCWILHDEALIVGWSPRALERARAGVETGVVEAGVVETGGDPAREGAAAGAILHVRFGRFPEAERRLAAASAADPAVLPIYPWKRIEVVGRRDGQLYRFELTAVWSSNGSPFAGNSDARNHGETMAAEQPVDGR